MALEDTSFWLKNIFCHRFLRLRLTEAFRPRRRLRPSNICKISTIFCCMFQHVPAILIWTVYEDFHSHTGHMSLILQAGNDVAEKMLNQGGPVRSRKSYFRYGWWSYLLLPAIGVCFLLFLSQETFGHLWRQQSSEDMRDKNNLTSKSFVWSMGISGS